MRKTIYANQEHQQAIETYLLMCEEFVKETSSKTRYQNYLQVIDLILPHMQTHLGEIIFLKECHLLPEVF